MKLNRNEVTFDLEKMTCVTCETQMIWSDESCEWKCPMCGTTAFQDENCAPDEVYYSSYS